MSTEINIEKIIYDKAVEAAYHAKFENITSAAVNNILEVFTQIEDSEEALKTTILFILRQNSRGILKKNTTKSLVNGLKEIFDKGGEKKKELARKFLGLFKWAFEATNSLNYKPARGMDKVDFKTFLGFFR